MMRGQRAESVGFDLKGAIESCAHVLERDRRRQIDDLLAVEVALDFREDLIGNLDGTSSHLLGIAECSAFGGGEQRILRVLSERAELLCADSKMAAAGSIDVDSEDAADHLRRAQTDHPLQRRQRDLRVFDGLHEERRRECDTRPIGPRFIGIEDFAAAPFHHPDEGLQQPAHLIFFDRLDSH
ncbi:MAG: hypothetical protein ACREQD_03755 [Candidatus Binataceae bacterium]